MFVTANPERAKNDLIDNNGIGHMLCIKYIIKITKFIIIILHVSFTVGMMWMIVCKFIEDFVQDVSYYHIF